MFQCESAHVRECNGVDVRLVEIRSDLHCRGNSVCGGEQTGGNCVQGGRGCVEVCVGGCVEVCVGGCVEVCVLGCVSVV